MSLESRFLPIDPVETVTLVSTDFPLPQFEMMISKNRSGLVVGLALLQAVLPLAGCHRQFYRKQADQEIKALLAEKACSVARPPEIDLGIEIDRRSRMYNPFDPDFQPMPLDDPAS
ncbi:MAG: hypothetical protein AAF989_09150, partial [Planctomycetota bacterium]